VTIGACATAGGIQALRNFADTKSWMQAIYATPETISTLDTATAISAHVKVDHEIYGCPVNSQQVLASLLSLLQKVTPTARRDKVCLECKRLGYVCVMVAKGEPCMGPVTHTGCGALCPSLGRGCYACYGPAENINTESFTKWLSSLGLSDEEISRRFLFIQNSAPGFKEAGLKLQKKKTP
jgi:coenzyme F420-reducing hydrogenase gamma subunit